MTFDDFDPFCPTSTVNGCEKDEVTSYSAYQQPQQQPDGSDLVGGFEHNAKDDVNGTYSSTTAAYEFIGDSDMGEDKAGYYQVAVEANSNEVSC